MSSFVIRSTERIDAKTVRVVVCTDELRLVAFVLPFRNTSEELLREVITAGLAAIPPTPKGRAGHRGRHV